MLALFSAVVRRLKLSRVRANEAVSTETASFCTAFPQAESVALSIGSVEKAHRAHENRLRKSCGRLWKIPGRPSFHQTTHTNSTTLPPLNPQARPLNARVLLRIAAVFHISNPTIPSYDLMGIAAVGTKNACGRQIIESLR